MGSEAYLQAHADTHGDRTAQGLYLEAASAPQAEDGEQEETAQAV
jgi:hypothetical protein